MEYVTYSALSISRATWWRHQMGKFSALLAVCVIGEFPTQRPVTRSFDIFSICAWINGWLNIRGAGDLRRNDVTIINFSPKKSGKKPNCSTARTSYGASFVSSSSEQNFSFLPFLLLYRFIYDRDISRVHGINLMLYLRHRCVFMLIVPCNRRYTQWTLNKIGTNSKIEVKCYWK